MNYIGRWERTRILGPNGLSPSYFWDRKWNTLMPVEKDRFFQTKDGIWLPHVRGSASNDGWNYQYGMRMGFEQLTLTAGSAAYNTVNLDSNYVYSSAGDAIGWRYTCHESKTLNNWFYFLAAIVGSPSTLTLEIREDDGAGAPGSTVTATTTDTPSVAGWNEKTGLSVSLSAGTTYWFIAADTGGGATDYFRLAKTSSWASDTRQIPTEFLMGLFTSNGWGTISTTDAFNCSLIVLNFSDGSSFGFPLTESSNPTNNDSQKGLYLDGMDVDVDIYGVLFGDSGLSSSAFSAVNIWANDDGPSGTPFATSSNPLYGTTTIFGAYFTKSYPRLAVSTPYRIVLDLASASSSTPERMGIGTVNGGGESRLRAALMGQGGWYWTEDDSNSWSDTTIEIPRIFLMIDDFQPNAAGGGGGSSNARNYPTLPTGRSYPIFPTV